MAKTKHKKPSKTLTPRQIKAVQHYVENGRSKGEALREAGYSEAMATHPDRVFGSPGVQALLEEAGITPVPVLQQLKRKVHSKRLDHMVFPPYRTAKEDEEEDDGDGFDDEGNVDILKERGEQLTDEQICDLLEEVGCTVRKIVHGDMARHVYFWADNDKAQLDAIEKVINLLGLYAPKKLETKNDHRVGIFSLSDLRRKMNEAGLQVTDNPNE